MATWKLKSCHRCGGDVFLDSDEHIYFEHCLQCGHWGELKSMAEFSEQLAPMVKVPALADKLPNKVHETILAIDSELSTAVDMRFRETLVETAYALRNLQERIQNAYLLP